MSPNELEKLLIIGISGVTCGGKTTTATKLNNILPKSKVFTQDDYYRDVTDPNHIWISELNHINFDIVTSVDMERMHSDVLKYIEDNNFVPIGSKKRGVQKNGFHLNRFNSDFYHKIKKIDINILIVEGFSILNYKNWLHLFDLKYYFILDKEECYKRRIERVYEPPDCPGYFEKCAWPEHLKLKEEIHEMGKDVQYLENIGEDTIEKILADISEYV